MLRQGGLYRYRTSLKRFLRKYSAGSDADIIALWQNHHTKNQSQVIGEIKRNDLCIVLSEPETYQRSIYPEIKVLTDKGIIGYIWYSNKEWIEASISLCTGSKSDE